MASHGKIDTLVCNAAVNPYYGPMSEISIEAYDKTMNSNVRSNLWLCNMVLPQMAERKDGSVIIISSIAGLAGDKMLGIYALSKAADYQLARNLAVEWGEHNIRANCIAPGLVKTDFARALWEDRNAAPRRSSATPWAASASPTTSPARPSSWPPARAPGSAAKPSSSTAAGRSGGAREGRITHAT